MFTYVYIAKFHNIFVKFIYTLFLHNLDSTMLCVLVMRFTIEILCFDLRVHLSLMFFICVRIGQWVKYMV